MGFFKSMHELTKQAKEIDKTFDPGQMSRDATARMANATQWMAQQTEAANASLAATGPGGVDIDVTIGAMHQVGMANFEPMMEFELTAMPAAGPPYTATTQQTVPAAQLALIKPGATLHGKVDPQNPSAIWLDMSSAR